MKNLTIISFLFIHIFASSQKIDVKSLSDDNYNIQKIENEFYKRNVPLFNLNNSSTTSLIFSIDNSKIFKIEGLSSKFSGQAKILVRVENFTSNNDTTFSFITSISTPNKYEIDEKILESFINNQDAFKKLSNNIHSYLLKKISSSCDNLIRLAYTDIKNKNWREAFKKANSVLSITNCSKEAKTALDQIEEGYGSEFCEEKLTRIKILAASGIEYKMELAIEELYKIPSKAKCKEEAVTISKQIGEYLLKKNNGSVKLTNLNQVVTQGSSLESIFNK